MVLRVPSGRATWLADGTKEGFCNYLLIKNLKEAKGDTSYEAAVFGRAMKQARRYLIVQTAERKPSKLPNGDWDFPS